jgi:chromosome segregation ATPase
MEEKLKAYFPWIMAAVVLFLLFALVVVGLLCNRGISTNRASTEKVSAEADRLNGEMEQARGEIDQLEAAIEKADGEIVELRAELKEAEAAGDRLREALREDLTEDISANADRLQEETAQAEFQVLLLKASAKALKARIHLAEEEAGLAERDLAECDAALEAAAALADGKGKTALQEIRKSIVELKDSVEARTFPIATLEIVSDKIDALIGE